MRTFTFRRHNWIHFAFQIHPLRAPVSLYCDDCRPLKIVSVSWNWNSALDRSPRQIPSSSAPAPPSTIAGHNSLNFYQCRGQMPSIPIPKSPSTSVHNKCSQFQLEMRFLPLPATNGVGRGLTTRRCARARFLEISERFSEGANERHDRHCVSGTVAANERAISGRTENVFQR
jgi:hypothetical protein